MKVPVNIKLSPFQLQWIVKEYRDPVTISEVFYNRLVDEFPGVDVEKQLKKAHAYAELNFVDPSYAKGLETFIVRWMRRNQNRAEQIKDTFSRSSS